MRQLPEFNKGLKVSELRGPLSQLRAAVLDVLDDIIKTGPGLFGSKRGGHYMLSTGRTRRRSGASPFCPFRLATDQPENYPDPPTAEGDYLWVEFGAVNQIPPTGVVNPMAVSTGQYVYLKATTNAVDEDWTVPLLVTAAEIELSASVLTDTGATPTKPPEVTYFLLGQILTDPGGDIYATNTGCGNLTLSLTGQGVQCVVADAGDSEADPPRPATPAGTRTVYQTAWSRG
jgi:hypothetical protein